MRGWALCALPGKKSGAGNSCNGTDQRESGSTKPQPSRFYVRAGCRANRKPGSWYLGRFSYISRGESAAILSLIVGTEFERCRGVAKTGVRCPKAASGESCRSQQMRVDPTDSFAKEPMLFEKFQHFCIFG
jgi:hypothetical protein